jgi:hypothetical protein
MDSYCSVFEAAGNISPDEPTPSALGEAGEATISPSELAENAIDSIYEPKSTKCMPHILTQDQQSNATPSEVRDKESGCLQSGDEARMYGGHNQD